MDFSKSGVGAGSVYESCQRRGISRRRFLQFCSAVTATLALPSGYAKVVAEALTQKRKPTVVWLEYQDCAGCTESMLRSASPTIEDIVLEAPLPPECNTLLSALSAVSSHAQ